MNASHLKPTSWLQPLRYLDGLNGGEESRSSEAMRHDALDINILILGGTPELEKNKSSGAGSSKSND